MVKVLKGLRVVEMGTFITGPAAAMHLADLGADVIKVEQLESAPHYPERCNRISIFMSVFNVHVNRIPHDGTVGRVSYYPGKFFSANLDKASSDNEHNAVFLETEAGRRICVVQIAGLVARRLRVPVVLIDL